MSYICWTEKAWNSQKNIRGTHCARSESRKVPVGLFLVHSFLIATLTILNEMVNIAICKYFSLRLIAVILTFILNSHKKAIYCNQGPIWMYYTAGLPGKVCYRACTHWYTPLELQGVLFIARPLYGESIFLSKCRKCSE